MENTLQNKAKFFAQYLFQDVLLGFANQPFAKKGNLINLNQYHVSPHYLALTDGSHIPKLFLKSIENITDEDAIELSKYDSYPNQSNPIKYGKELVGIFIKKGFWCAKYDAIDFLRSRGYAVPFLDLSISDLVSYEWIVLK
jgi:hypothetical protein